jgi:hypothetical protein
MNNDEAKAAMIKLTRREILKALNMMYHIGPLSFPGLCSALLHLELPDEQCVQRDLVYLVDKGYVNWTNRPTRGRFVAWNERFYKLTAQGNEIAEKISEDAALEP